MKNILPTFLQSSKIILCLILVTNLFSCASKMDILYFQDSENMNLEEINKTFEPLIEENDISLFLL